MNAKRLPSGNYRAKAYDYTDECGKSHYRSFTAPTKKEAERLANEFMFHKENAGRHDLTIREAIDGYISAKEGVLSPSTIKGYRKMQRCNFAIINEKRIQKVTSEDLQKFVSSLAKDLSPKTVSNIYGLLSSSLSLYMPDRIFRVTLPAKVKKRRISPSDDDIRALYEKAGKTLKKCILLAAFGSMRRGEICAITYGDISGCEIYVHRDMVENTENEWILKENPKTSSSCRVVQYPEKVIKALGTGSPDEFVIKIIPSTITKDFCELRDKLGLSMSFHDLRHYYASIGVVLGVPDTYLSEFGGWRQGSSVLKEIYQNRISQAEKDYRKKMSDHFGSLFE